MLAADEPQPELENDLFGHGEYATVLERAIRSAPERFTIGLFGEWGIGKTTILGQLRRRFEPKKGARQPDDVFVEFDAWRYEHDALRREFLRVVAGGLEGANALGGFVPARELRALDRDVSRTQEIGTALSRTRLLVFALAVAVVAGVALYVGGAFTSPDVPLTLLVLLPLVTFLFTRFERIFLAREETVSEKRLEDPDRFAAVFVHLVRKFTGKRLVIAIDNLDRCDPETVGDVLATIKTYLEPDLRRHADDDDVRDKAVVFVIAVDDEALRGHLMALAPRRVGTSDDEHARDARAYADEYLRKFFNATLPVQTLRSGDTERFFREELATLVASWPVQAPDPSLGDVPDVDRQRRLVEDMAMAALRRNPRRIRQFLNTLELRMALIREREREDVGSIKPAISPYFAMVAKLALIAEEWPDRYRRLRDRPALLGEWEEIEASAPPEGADLGPDWERFAAFLRVAGRVSSPAVFAFLKMKLTAEEAATPGFEELVEAAAEARYDDAAGVVEAGVRQGVEAVRYASVLRDELRRALEEGRTDAAGQIMRTLLEVPALRRLQELRDEMLERLIDAGEDVSLTGIDPLQLSDAATTLSDRHQDVLLTRIAEPGTAPAPRDHEVMIALAHHRKALTDEARKHAKERADKAWEQVAELGHPGEGDAASLARSGLGAILELAEKLAGGEPINSEGARELETLREALLAGFLTTRPLMSEPALQVFGRFLEPAADDALLTARALRYAVRWRKLLDDGATRVLIEQAAENLDRGDVIRDREFVQQCLDAALKLVPDGHEEVIAPLAARLSDGLHSYLGDGRVAVARREALIRAVEELRSRPELLS